MPTEDIQTSAVDNFTESNVTRHSDTIRSAVKTRNVLSSELPLRRRFTRYRLDLGEICNALVEDTCWLDTSRQQ